MMKKIAMMLMVLVLVFGFASEVRAENPFDVDLLHEWFEQEDFNMVDAMVMAQYMNRYLGEFTESDGAKKPFGSYIWNEYIRSRSRSIIKSNFYIGNQITWFYLYGEEERDLLEKGDYRFLDLEGVVFSNLDFKEGVQFDRGWGPQGAIFDQCSFKGLFSDHSSFARESGVLGSGVFYGAYFYYCDLSDFQLAGSGEYNTIDFFGCKNLDRESFENGQRLRREQNNLPRTSILEEQQAVEIAEKENTINNLQAQVKSLFNNVEQRWKDIEELERRLGIYQSIFGNIDFSPGKG